MTDPSRASANVPANTPSWTIGARGRTAFARGLAVAATTPGAVLFLTALGFGTLVRDAAMPLGHALFLSLAMYALPAQVMVVDQLQRGAAVLGIAIAVTLTAVRLLPMTVALLPYLRTQGAPLWQQLAAVHFIAVTSWIEGNRRLPPIPEPLRFPHFIGIGVGMVAATSTGAVVGYVLAARIPMVLQTALLFMTPIYFLLSTIASAQTRRDWFALVFGGALAPLVYLVLPDLDLLIAGIVGGTAAYVLGRAHV
jgi:predicted branched-subunit amino acid permease